MAITKKTTIGEVLNLNIETAKFFMEIGMHCLGCPASQGESIEEACMVHGTNADGKYDFNTAPRLYCSTRAAGRAACRCWN